MWKHEYNAENRISWEKKMDGAVSTTRKYYAAVGQKVAVRPKVNAEPDTLNWLLGDHLGSTSMAADASGEVISEIRYTAFGETRYENGVTPTDYRYTGQREEAELGLYYYVARWYDPALGRFTQADTIVPNPGSAKTYDRYAYVYNNPLKYVDPSGHAPFVTPLQVDDDGGGGGEEEPCELGKGSKYCELDNGAFIDESHVAVGVAQEFWTNLLEARGAGETTIKVGPQNTGGMEFEVEYQVDIPESMSDEDLASVGLAIWIDFQKRFEMWQWTDFLGKNKSAYSTEDIPSTYIAYWMAVTGESYSTAIELLGGGKSTDKRPSGYSSVGINCIIDNTSCASSSRNNTHYFKIKTAWRKYALLPYPEDMNITVGSDEYWSYLNVTENATPKNVIDAGINRVRDFFIP